MQQTIFAKKITKTQKLFFSITAPNLLLPPQCKKELEGETGKSPFQSLSSSSSTIQPGTSHFCTTARGEEKKGGGRDFSHPAWPHWTSGHPTPPLLFPRHSVRRRICLFLQDFFVLKPSMHVGSKSARRVHINAKKLLLPIERSKGENQVWRISVGLKGLVPLTPTKGGEGRGRGERITQSRTSLLPTKEGKERRKEPLFPV